MNRITKRSAQVFGRGARNLSDSYLKLQQQESELRIRRENKETPENNPAADHGGAIVGCLELLMPALILWLLVIVAVVWVAKW